MQVRSSYRRQRIAAFVGNRLAVSALTVLVLISLFCFVGPLLYHTNQTSVDLLYSNLPPSRAHLLGFTDDGFDELGRLMIGGQVTLEMGFGATIFATLFGLVYGTISGYAGGIVDAVGMRIVDALLSIPFLFFIILLASLVQPTLLLIMLLLASVSWLGTARLTRGETLKLRTRDYVEAAVGFGTRRRQVLVRHVVPNLLGPLVVSATFMVADNILTFAYLSYLGLGLEPPATNWGILLSSGVNNLFDGYWWQLWPPAVLIVLTVLSVNILGDASREAIESRLQSR